MAPNPGFLYLQYRPSLESELSAAGPEGGVAVCIRRKEVEYSETEGISVDDRQLYDYPVEGAAAVWALVPLALPGLFTEGQMVRLFRTRAAARQYRADLIEQDKNTLRFKAPVLVWVQGVDLSRWAKTPTPTLPRKGIDPLPPTPEYTVIVQPDGKVAMVNFRIVNGAANTPCLGLVAVITMRPYGHSFRTASRFVVNLSPLISPVRGSALVVSRTTARDLDAVVDCVIEDYHRKVLEGLAHAEAARLIPEGFSDTLAPQLRVTEVREL